MQRIISSLFALKMISNLGLDNDINRSSFLNLANFESMESFFDFFAEIDYLQFYGQNFLRKQPDFQSVVDAIFGDFRSMTELP